MTHTFKLARRAARFRTAAAIAAVIGLGACDNADRLGPLNPADAPIALADTAPADPTAIDTLVLTGDTLSDAEAEANEALPEAAFVSASTTRGIAFGQYQMKNTALSPVYNAVLRLPGPGNIIMTLASARAKGGRVLVKLANHDKYTMNRNGTFNLSKWKTQISRFKKIKFDSYIKDGTLLGHYLLDEPYDASNWGGRKIPPKTVEEMAKFSKKLWPGMTTFVRAPPDYLAATGIKYKYLDVGWAMYEYSKSRTDVRKWIKTQASAARRAGIKLVVGLNVLNGGAPGSGIRGVHSRYKKYGMSAKQVRSWGAILLEEAQACAFYNWRYDAKYYGRSDIKSAMNYLSSKIKSRSRTSCR
jgi:hypothetical protein